MKSYYTVEIPGSAKPGIADVVFFPLFDGFVIHRINIPEGHRGKGHGTTLLRKIISDAEAEGVNLLLSPVPSGGLAYDDLVAWYERHGFEITHSGAMMEMVRKHPAEPDLGYADGTR